MALETLVDLFEHACSTYDKPNALMWKVNGAYQSMSSEDFRQQVRQVGAGLARLDVCKADRIALISENRPEWAISDLAILSIGAINVPMYTTLPAAQIQELLNDSKAKIVLVSTTLQLQKVLSTNCKTPCLQTIVLMNDEPVAEKQVLSFSQLLTLGKETLREQPSLFDSLRQQVKGEDVASIIYTSGTTGTPKGVMLTHRNIVTNVLDSVEGFDIGPSDSSLSFLPLCHIFERMFDYMVMYCGATLAYAESFESVAQNLQEVRPTVVASVPRFFEKMYARIQEAMRTSPPAKRRLMRWAISVGKERSRRVLKKQGVPPRLQFQYALADKLVFSKLRERLGGRIRFFISGGAPLDKELAEFFFSVGVLILEGYGLTETSPVIAVNRLNDFKLGTVGKPLRHVEVKIAEDGEILTRGPSVMLGYYKREAETREALAGGWFHTGDVGALDADGFLSITDRKKDLIVTASGKNVAPQKIEGLLKNNPCFVNIVAVGNRRPFVSALVVPNPDKIRMVAKELGLDPEPYHSLMRSDKIKEFLLQQIHASAPDLAPFEQIKRIEILETDFSIDAGELTPTMKVRRRFVESKYQDLIDRLYASP
jgi:long-chain acyl-CoA synthetase